MLLPVQFEGEQKYVKLSELTFDAFLKEEERQSDIKVYDQSDTEVDSEVFEEIAKESPGTFRVTLCNEELGASQSLSSSVRSDDTFTLNLFVCDPHEEVATGEGSQPKRPCRINYEAKTEHYYDPESGSGYLAWRLKTIQRKTAEERSASGSKSPKVCGPGHGRRSFTSDDVPTNEDVEAAIAVLRYSADEDTVCAKMKTTFIYRKGSLRPISSLVRHTVLA
ncbi:hypothetical protein SRHO_G00101490 [Serrasalmus rhombeus]